MRIHLLHHSIFVVLNFFNTVLLAGLPATLVGPSLKTPRARSRWPHPQLGYRVELNKLILAGERYRMHAHKIAAVSRQSLIVMSSFEMLVLRYTSKVENHSIR